MTRKKERRVITKAQPPFKGEADNAPKATPDDRRLIQAVKDWEQKRRTPERATRILLSVIATNPRAIEKALDCFII